jgi:glutaredoxin-related protein
VLKKHGVEYTYYNVLDDSRIPQWVRHYSGFQTYPQLFVNGKFLGDVDICVDL